MCKCEGINLPEDCCHCANGNSDCADPFLSQGACQKGPFIRSKHRHFQPLYFSADDMMPINLPTPANLSYPWQPAINSHFNLSSNICPTFLHLLHGFFRLLLPQPPLCLFDAPAYALIQVVLVLVSHVSPAPWAWMHRSSPLLLLLLWPFDGLLSFPTTNWWIRWQLQRIHGRFQLGRIRWRQLGWRHSLPFWRPGMAFTTAFSSSQMCNAFSSSSAEGDRASQARPSFARVLGLTATDFSAAACLALPTFAFDLVSGPMTAQTLKIKWNNNQLLIARNIKNSRSSCSSFLTLPPRI